MIRFLINFICSFICNVPLVLKFFLGHFLILFTYISFSTLLIAGSFYLLSLLALPLLFFFGVQGIWIFRSYFAELKMDFGVLKVKLRTDLLNRYKIRHQLETDIYSQIPVIGKLLHLDAVHTIIKDGSPRSVRILANAVTRLNDKKRAENVLGALAKVSNQNCINAFCKIWADTRHRDLTNLLVKKSWVASAPINIRVLSALKAKQLQVVINGGQEIVEPLLNAFKDRDAEIANQASELAISLTNLETIDYICQKWVRNRDKLLEQLVCRGKYVARQPIEIRVFTALKIGKLEIIQDGGKEVVEPLLQALNDKDAEIANWASECAISLTNPEAIDYICQKWVRNRDKLLEQLVCRGKYVARQPIEIRVFTALKIGKLEIIQDGGKEVVEPLLQALNDKDAEIANWASECAISLTNPEAIDYICDLTIKQDYQIAHQIAIKAQYAPRKLSQKALFYFLTDQGDKYESLDFEHSLLQAAFKHSNEQLCQKITGQIRKAGRVELLKVFAGGHKDQLLGEMTHAEWDTTLTILNNCKQWEEMWRLAQKAPAIWSSQLLQKLKQVAWIPKSEEQRKTFGRLRQLADKCLEKTMPMGKLTCCQATLTGHTGHISHISFSPDGQLLASCSWDKTIRLWQMPDSKHLATLTGHTHGVDCISFSPDGQLLASCSGDGTIRLWQMPDGKHLSTLTGHTEHISHISFSPDGQLLASCSGDGTIRLWQMPDGKYLATLTGHTGHISHISFSPDGQLLASCSGDGTIRLWQMPDGKHLATLTTGHTHENVRISFSPDGQLLASYSGDGTIRLWQMPDGKHLATLTGHTHGDVRISFSPDGQLLASCSYDETISLWQMPDGKHLATFTTGHTRGGVHISFNPDGQLLASCSGDGTIRLWQMPDGKHLATLTGHTHGFWNVSFSPDSQLLASCSNCYMDYTIRLWSSPVFQLSHLPIKQLGQHNRESVQKTLQHGEINKEERNWLEFMQALMDSYQRFDVEVEDAPQLINTGEFDIEIEG